MAYEPSISSLSRVAYERILRLSWVAYTKLTPVIVARKTERIAIPPGRVAFPRQAMTCPFNSQVDENRLPVALI